MSACPHAARTALARAASTGMAAALALGLALALAPATAVPARAQAHGPASVADIAEQLMDAVVNISTSQSVGGQSGIQMPEVPEGSPFKEFFEEFFDRQRRGEQQQRRRVQSLGSGFVIDAGGLIVTNNHVIADADEIIANFSDGTKLTAEVVGRDPKTDLAVLRVSADQALKAVPFGDSDALRVGDWVMAIGNPFGLGGSLSVGVVSAVNRNINSGPYDNFIQTDAAINRGNSGGPLFNMDGEVVGVNTAIFSPTGGSVGIGFSVPSVTVRQVIDQLVQYGETRRGWLGVRIQQVTEDLAESLGLDAPRGALIAGVTPDGPAAIAGVETGDLILEFAGKPIAEMRDLPRIVADTEPDRQVPMLVMRDGKEMTMEVLVGRLEEAEGAPEPTPRDDGDGGEDDHGDEAENGEGQVEESQPARVLGMELSSLTDALRRRFGIQDEVEGVVVVDIDPASAAAERGVVPGTVITEVAQEEVREPAQVSARLEALAREGRRIAQLLVSDVDGELRFIALEVKE